TNPRPRGGLRDGRALLRPAELVNKPSLDTCAGVTRNVRPLTEIYAELHSGQRTKWTMALVVSPRSHDVGGGCHLVRLIAGGTSLEGWGGMNSHGRVGA